MSSREMRMSGVFRSPATLEDRLRIIGIKVPDQSKIPYMMEATRIGLLPTVSPLRLAFAWYRRLNHSESYTVFDYEHFVHLDHKFDRVANSFGGMPPDVVARDVETIGRLIPEAKCFVHATFDDPWLEVRRAGESIFIHCWMRPGPHMPVVLVI